MIRRATESDVARIFEIRNSVRENRLNDSSRVTLDDVRWFVANPGIFVWEQDGRVVGFSAADPRNGNIWALFVDAGYERRGIGRLLFEQACNVLRDAGCKRMWLTTAPGTRAAAFYRAAGWRVAGRSEGDLLLETEFPPRPKGHRAGLVTQ